MEHMTMEEVEKESTSEKMSKFKKEISDLKEKEEKEGASVHFRGMSTENLTEEDLQLWEKFKNKTLEPDEFNAYRRKVANGSTKNDDSHLLAQYIANKIINWEEWKK